MKLNQENGVVGLTLTLDLDEVVDLMCSISESAAKEISLEENKERAVQFVRILEENLAIFAKQNNLES